MGTRHQRLKILEFIATLLRRLPAAGITHIGLEIESDQQASIDHFLQHGSGLETIRIHPMIDCPEYRHLLTII